MSERDDITEQAFHTPDHKPHSRACGVIRHEHGSACHSNCPTCSGFSGTAPNYAIRSQVVQAVTGFDFLLGMQQEVESIWNRAVDPRDPEAVSKYIREVILCATDELHEVLAEVHWKPWKDKRGIKNKAKYREEMADVLHFILDLYLAAGLTGADIVADYTAKNRENLARNSSQEYRAS